MTAKVCLLSRPTWSKQQWVLGSKHWSVVVVAAAVGALRCSGCCGCCCDGGGSDMEHGSC